MSQQPDFSLFANLFPRLVAGIRGQNHVVAPVAKALQRTELGFAQPGRFLFLGPTGTGKTQLTLNCTKILFGDPSLCVRFDCSEFDSAAALSILLGNRDGDRGRFGDLKDSKARVLLFDEFEKSCREFRQLLLQILEPGHITLACGETIDLSRFYRFATSNVASEAIADLFHSTPSTVERHVLQRAREVFRPETVNRFDLAVVFRPLDFDTQNEICRLKLEEYLDGQRAKGWVIAVAPEVVPFLLRFGFDRQLGARPLGRAIEQFVGDALVEATLSESRQQGTLIVDTTGTSLVFLPA